MSGLVSLIGAGCGRADLITLRGLRLLQRCDVVVYDDLIDRSLLDMAPPQAERIYMGKRQGRPSPSQEEICRLLIQKAQAGRRVARLKGGDPFVFGRGGEELLALRAAGVPCEEVPGVSSAIAIPAAAGIPVTHRGLSQSVHVVTGHTIHTPDGLPADLSRLAALEGTLVFLMGLSRLEQLAAGLLAAGKAPDTPAAVISGGCAPNPMTVRGTLADIAQRAAQAQVTPPAVIVVGRVAALELTPTVSRPLDGLSVGITGTPAITGRLRPLLEEQGAAVHLVSQSTVAELPLELDWAALCDGAPRWLVFTSANGVRVFFRQLNRRRLDVRRLHACKFAVIGRATGQALAEYGIQADLCPAVYTSQALADALCQQAEPGEEVVLLRSQLATPLLPQALAGHKIAVREIPLYTLRPAGGEAAPPPLDYLLFASASGVEQFFRGPAALSPRTVCACIGPVSALALAAHTDRPFLTAPAATVPALVEVVCQDARQKRTRQPLPWPIR